MAYFRQNLKYFLIVILALNWFFIQNFFFQQNFFVLVRISVQFRGEHRGIEASDFVDPERIVERPQQQTEGHRHRQAAATRQRRDELAGKDFGTGSAARQSGRRKFEKIRRRKARPGKGIGVRRSAVERSGSSIFTLRFSVRFGDGGEVVFGELEQSGGGRGPGYRQKERSGEFGYGKSEQQPKSVFLFFTETAVRIGHQKADQPNEPEQVNLFNHFVRFSRKFSLDCNISSINNVNH